MKSQTNPIQPSKPNTGFTLIELLVVIAILAILAGVVVFAVGNSTDNAEVAACKTERAALITAFGASKTANYANSAGSQESFTDYLPAGSGSFDWFNTPATPIVINAGVAIDRKNTTKVDVADCKAITDAEVPGGSV